MMIALYIIIAISTLILIFLLRLLKKPKYKGLIGEYKVAKELKRLDKCEIINDIILDNKDTTSQIDHIIISHKGIYVVETKNYSGKIYGTQYSEKWKQYLADGNVENSFYSPVRQNHTHVELLKRKIGREEIYSIVVFINADISHVDAENVYTIEEFSNFINTINFDYEPGGPFKNIDILSERIYSLESDANLKDHINNVKNKIHKKRFCPRCGNKLELVKSIPSYYRCSRFPDCNYVLNEDK